MKYLAWLLYNLAVIAMTVWLIFFFRNGWWILVPALLGAELKNKGETEE